MGDAEPGGLYRHSGDRAQRGDRIDLGSLTLRVIHTPTYPGHCAFLVEEYIYSLLRHRSFALRALVGNDSSDLEQFQQSVESPLAGCGATYHQPQPAGEEDIDGRLEMALSSSNAIELITGSSEKGADVGRADRSKTDLRRHPEPARIYRFEGNMLKKHLDLLISRG